VAYNIIGGGEEGKKVDVSTKEGADHSLPYILAVALLDGEVTPRQYERKRIIQKDAQSLLRRIAVAPDPEFSTTFPTAMPCAISIDLSNGKVIKDETKDYEGFFTRPMSWESAVVKFDTLVHRRASGSLRKEMVDTVGRQEEFPVSKLTSLLAKVR
jgi:2-methylcitrate dehydratase